MLTQSPVGSVESFFGSKKAWKTAKGASRCSVEGREASSRWREDGTIKRPREQLESPQSALVPACFTIARPVPFIVMYIPTQEDHRTTGCLSDLSARSGPNKGRRRGELGTSATRLIHRPGCILG